ncbi:glycosyl hydrolase family 95 catalytic domain-containing protein [Pseudobacter ginsenosidimutans]|uniref:Uncharacterized protein n=1 Tax=Pseudobacter ginsenosidimutans TaxID=661488 RepID=A0A4Q7MG82_9BACT|nr:DUF5703 domain-containing protein [Pseudobacter ginsenosidimutans]QEC45575.1 glycoside hydrolase [Pseudobacter ginsenosidimutans]RZS67121.1 hypothetical protein EV199_5506 [Pseudobacter ginsenosidimutans]
MIKCIPLLFVFLCAFELSAQTDYRKIVNASDLHYATPVGRSEDGMPTGNGRMGSLVWTIPSALKFQLNRVDVFGNNSSSHNFFERHTDYCNGTGTVSIDFGTAVFTNTGFSQHLDAYDATVQVKGGGVDASILTSAVSDVMSVSVKDNRKIKLPVQVVLSSLRKPDMRRGNHRALSKAYVQGDYIVLTQQFTEDQYYCASAVAIQADAHAKAVQDEQGVVRLLLRGSARNRVLIATAASFDSTEDIAAKAIQILKQARTISNETLLREHRAWWHQFWKRSYIQCSSANGDADFIQQHYQYYLYVMASSSRGSYPTKFNGMLWTTGGDERKWGGLYWGANQSCLYNALFATNHTDLLQPMFNMYSNAYRSYELAAEQQWGSKGVFIPEVTGFDPTPPLPEDIAAEMRELYLCKKKWEDRSQHFIDYSYTLLPFISRWNWKKDEGWKNGIWHTGDKGGGAFGHTTHIFSRGAKIAYQYWMQFEYTQDTAFLKQFAYPMLKGVAEFYRNFPNFRQEEDGLFHIRHVNDNESIWNGHNTVEEISSMRGIFPVAIRAAMILKIDQGLQREWKNVLEHLSPLPLNEAGNAWVGSLPPVQQGNAGRRPDGNTMPVWFFDLCTLQNPDPATLRIARNTYHNYYPQGIGKDSKVFVLSKLPVAGITLGLKEATEYLIPAQLRTAEIIPLRNRMDLREGAQTTSVQRLGRAAEALQLALCQSLPPAPGEDPVIRVFPAWPEQWKASFKLAARSGFLVSSSFANGQVEFVEAEAMANAVLKLDNPWKGRRVAIYIGKQLIRESIDDLIVFSATKGSLLKFVPVH